MTVREAANTLRESKHSSQANSVQQCEAIIVDFMRAFNTRDFALPTWKRIAPDMQVAWGVFTHQTLSLEEWLRVAKILAEQNPNYRFAISNLTTIVDEKFGTAESLRNVEHPGYFNGIGRQSVAGFGSVRTSKTREIVRHDAFAGSAFF